MRIRLLLASSLLVAGCGMGDDSASTSDDLRINPSGPGGDITVTIVVPDAVTSGPLRSQSGYFSGGTTIVPNTPTRVAYQPGVDGRQTVTLSYWVGGALFTSTNSFPVTSSGSLRVELGAFKVTGFIPTASNLSLDVDGYYPQRTLVRSIGPGVAADWIPQSGGAGWDLLEGHAIPAFVGDYQWLTQVGDPKPFHVAAGQLSMVDETVSNPFAAVSVHLPPAALPDALSDTPLYLECRSLNTHGIQGSITQRFSVFTKGRADCRYTVLGVAGPSFGLDPHGSQVIDLGRLDVDDVTLTDEPAGTKVQGSWTVLQNGNGIVSTTTKHGVYLPHGRYHLVITYVSPHGTPQKLEQDIDL